MADKPLLWVGTSRRDVRAFPESARRLAGFQLRRLQAGLLPADWKPISSVGPGVQELRIHTATEHRIIYIARFSEGVYVLHAFEKRTRRTPDADLTLARRRLSELIAARRQD